MSAVNLKYKNTLLKELLDLEAEVKPKVKRIEEIKTWCKDQGSFSTDSFVCSIKPHTREGMVPLSIAVERVGRDTLEEFELIKMTEYSTVNVSPKATLE